MIGYISGSKFEIKFAEAPWMSKLVRIKGSYKMRMVIKEVTFEYERLSNISTIKIKGNYR